MDGLPDSLEQVIVELARLPGIGRKTAQRLALHLVRADVTRARALAQAIQVASERIIPCDTCFGMSETPTCRLCLDPSRDAGVLCVVEQATDVLLIESTHMFRGRYHVLGGALSPLDGIDPDDIRLRELIERVAAEPITEVVLATNPNPAGEATASWIHEHLAHAQDVLVMRLAHGLPIGIDLEHADEVTLSRAFSARREY